MDPSGDPLAFYGTEFQRRQQRPDPQSEPAASDEPPLVKKPRHRCPRLRRLLRLR